ncbi:MAG: cysteine desulfurase family protein [Lachnospiraceae bacterium]|nr:cysteine desulfurase family protein [Lachnospiraceae bacterium]
MECYFDNSATTRVKENVIETMVKVMKEDFGNPSSKHQKGVESERYLKDARDVISHILKVESKEILFTSGGTESNNMAIIGSAMANKRAGKHLITTCFEHPSVLETFKYLEGKKEEGFEVTYLPVDQSGHISLEDLKAALRPDTILVSVMMVNNEIGAVQDIASIGKLIKEHDPDCIFHVDAVQGFGKYEIFPKKWNVDLLSVSAHKIHGPKGAGFLYINDKIKIHPIKVGGGQQKGRRSGPDNVPGVAGMAIAALDAYQHLGDNVRRMTMLKDQLTEGLEKLSAQIPEVDIRINSKKGEASAPHIVSCVFAPVKSEVLLHALEERGIYVSSGSACASNKPGLSGTLEAIGLSKKEADCTLRFSFSDENNAAQVEYALEQLKELLPLLSKFVSR